MTPFITSLLSAAVLLMVAAHGDAKWPRLTVALAALLLGLAAYALATLLKRKKSSENRSN